MPPNSTLRLAVAQAHTLASTASTLVALEKTSIAAARSGVDVLLFPEAYLGGYPRGATFGAAVGAREVSGREQFLRHFKDAVDLGDSPVGDGERWVRRELARGSASGSASVGVGVEEGVRGDGTREELERVARETGVFIVVGLVERAGGTLYCSVVYVEPERGVIGKRRKVMPTGSERLIWGQGQPASLRAVTTVIRDVKLTLAAAICWENYMPLLRYSLYSQNVNLYFAPTADARDTWLPLLRTIASEGRCFVLSSNQCVKKAHLPGWIYGEKADQIEVLEAPHNVGFRRESSSFLEKSGSLPPKLGHGRWKSRRKSVFTEDGHEICLPVNGGSQLSEDVFEELGGPSQNSGGAWGKGRRKSVFTEDGHEICLPVNGGTQLSEDVFEETESPSPELQNSHAKNRRKSVFTEDGNEICLSINDDTKAHSATERQSSGEMVGESESTSHALNNGHGKRRKSIFTDDGHEISLPADSYTKSDSTSDFQLTRGKTEISEFACRGGSCIISPFGDVLAGPSWEKEDDLLMVDVDFDDCLRGRLDLDVAGSYSRNDAFKLTVEGLDLSPPV